MFLPKKDNKIYCVISLIFFVISRNVAITDMADRFKNIEDSTENLRNTADMLAHNISNFNI